MIINFQVTNEVQEKIMECLEGSTFEKPLLRLEATKTQEGLTYSFFDIDKDELTISDEQLDFDTMSFVLDKSLLSSFDNVKLDFKDGRFYFSKIGT